MILCEYRANLTLYRCIAVADQRMKPTALSGVGSVVGTGAALRQHRLSQAAVYARAVLNDQLC
jgi:hypothetical protein